MTLVPSFCHTIYFLSVLLLKKDQRSRFGVLQGVDTLFLCPGYIAYQFYILHESPHETKVIEEVFVIVGQVHIRISKVYRNMSEGEFTLVRWFLVDYFRRLYCLLSDFSSFSWTSFGSVIVVIRVSIISVMWVLFMVSL